MAARSERKPKPRAGKPAAGGLSDINEFIRTHAALGLFRTGLDQETAQSFVDKVSDDDLAAIIEECGGLKTDQTDEPATEADAPPKTGIAAIGDGSFLKMLWDNRQAIAKVVMRIIALLALKEDTIADPPPLTKAG